MTSHQPEVIRELITSHLIRIEYSHYHKVQGVEELYIMDRDQRLDIRTKDGPSISLIQEIVYVYACVYIIFLLCC